MPFKLTERSRVKDLLGIARADSLNDFLIDGLIGTATQEAETFCRRKFAKAARTEYFQSYDQDPFDPTPQYLWLDGPVDTEADFTLTWALYGKHDTQGEVLTPEHYHLDAEQGLVTVQGKWGVNNLALLLPFHYGSFGYDPRGFRVAYTGGYAFSEDEDTGTSDPLDDFGALDVPIGLRQIIAQKVVEDWRGDGEICKVSIPWTLEQQMRLRPWMKKDRLY